MSDKQPEALRLANEIDKPWLVQEPGSKDKAAATLRSQHALIAELVEALTFFHLYASGERQGHMYEGDCPDDSQPDSRDPTCPACKAMVRAADAISKAKEQQ